MYELTINSHGAFKFGVKSLCDDLIQDHGFEVKVLIKSGPENVEELVENFLMRLRGLSEDDNMKLSSVKQDFIKNMRKEFYSFGSARSKDANIRLKEIPFSFYHYELKGC